MEIGPRKVGNGIYRFNVWAPFADRVEVEILEASESLYALSRTEGGYWQSEPVHVPAGTLYRYILNDSIKRPDPASHFQPRGVHGPSALVDHDSFPWTDQTFTLPPLSDLIIYELHVGTFTEEGTFDGVIRRLDDLVDLGINAIELMPVAQFPGDRNWGYDGVGLFAVQNSYGGPAGLKRLVNACHERGILVILDVVFNHLGPEGNYLGNFGPYFTDRYVTPWGAAVNFDGPMSDEVRNFFLENALHWLDCYHIDGLRLDATHAIFDQRPDPFLRALGRHVHAFGERVGRAKYLFPETNLNDPRLVTPTELGGMGLDCMWSDDFHHSVHTLLTGELDGYYEDYGSLEHLARVMAHGFTYQGEYSRFRRRGHGASVSGLPGHRFLVSVQNHDQVGNRLNGERLPSMTSFEGLKVAAGLMLLAPYIPLLFMGEEYGEENPFLYFVSHGDPQLVEAVRRGRIEEFKEFAWDAEPHDPQSVEAFNRSKLSWEKREIGTHRVLFGFYKELIRLRKTSAVLTLLHKDKTTVWSLPGKRLLLLQRSLKEEKLLVFFNLSEKIQHLHVEAYGWGTDWRKVLDSAEAAWSGPGSTMPPTLEKEMRITGMSVAVYGHSSP